MLLFIFQDVEISHGFLQIAEALQYLHTVRKKLHMNVSPENIVLTPGGEWKLCGLGFSLAFANEENKIAIPYYLNPVATKSILLEPDLRYMGQEMSEAGGTLRYAFASSDLFSLGVTMYEAYRFNLQLARAGRSNVSIVNVSNNNVDDHYHRALKDLERLDYSMIPQGVQQILRGMLQLPAHGRIGNIDIINNPFFHSGALAIMRSIGTIITKDLGGQASTLSSLPSQICDFPPRLLENYVLPVVCKLGCKDPSMWKYSLPLYVFISTKISSQAYARAATSSLITGLNEKGSVDSLVAFVAHSEHLLEKMGKEFFAKHVVKMLCNALDKQGESAVQGSAISVLTKDVIFGAVESELFLGELVPRVCRETCKNTNFEVKVSFEEVMDVVIKRKSLILVLLLLLLLLFFFFFLFCCFMQLKGLYFLSVVAKRFDPPYVTKNILPSLKVRINSIAFI
jgi:SCY1-like protein 2